MILCGLGTWTNYGSHPLRWEKWWRSLRLGTLCSDPFSWNQWKWGNFSPGNDGLRDKNGDILPTRGLNQPGDSTREQPVAQCGYWKRSPENHSSGQKKRGAWKLDGLLLKMTKMWLPALQIWPISLNILNIETAWEKSWRLKFEKGMFVSRHVNRTIWCIYKNLTTIMSQLALWSLKLANN